MPREKINSGITCLHCLHSQTKKSDEASLGGFLVLHENYLWVINSGGNFSKNCPQYE